MASSPSLGASFSEVEQERYQQLRALVVSCVPFFGQVDPTEEGLHIKVLQGGITNQLYKITAPSLVQLASTAASSTGCTHSVVVRIFGKETDKIISRDAEQFWQSKFLRTFGRYESALVYEYLDGFRPLDYPEMSTPHYTKPIAKELARFHDHAARVNTFSTTHHSPNFLQVFVSKWVPMVMDKADVTRRVLEGKGDAEGFESYSSLHWTDTTTMAGGAGDISVTVLEKELIELGHILAVLQENGELPVGISHNDLLSGNIMVRDCDEGVTPDVRLIDFEYAQSCYTYYDIANHLCEWAGFDCEYEKYFPTKDAVKLFLTDYFGEGARLVSGGANGGGNIDAAITEKELDRAADIVLFFSLYSHLVWAVWAVIQGMYSVIDFPYLPYSTLRWAQYLRTKEQFINALNTK